MVVGDLAESTEIAVIGAGPGGYVAAIRLAQLGKDVTLISDDPLPGGTCLLRGCIPSKALIEVASLWTHLHQAQELGLRFENARIEWGSAQSWKNEVVKKLAQGTALLVKQYGAKWLEGRARFLSPHSLQVQGPRGPGELRFEQAIIATGSAPRPLKGFEFDGKHILSSTEALTLEEIPESLLVIGGGYIGLELGQAYARLGSRVTVAEATATLLPGVDADLLRPLARSLKGANIEILLEARATEAETTKSGLRVGIETAKGEKSLREFSKILVAVGRVPFTLGLDLEKLPLATDERGFITVNERCQTHIEHIFAIGDVAGGMMLAHKASREGIVAAEVIAGHAAAFDNQVPAVIFTDPEIAYVGLFEEQAVERGIEVKTGMFPFAANGRALTLNQKEGFIKVVAEQSTGRVLGVQIVGPHASDLISEVTLGIEMGAMAEDFDLTIHPHPSLSEVLHGAVESVLGMPIHRFQKKQK